MPIVSDLDAAMMQPAVSVPAVRRLGGGTIRLNDDARPLRVSGRDAVVYELRTTTGPILALRCLRRPDPRRDAALAQQYSELQHDPALEPLRGPAGPLPRDIRWISDGIVLPGSHLERTAAPIMSMERVPGRTMAMAVDRLCREGQSGPLALLADSWLETAITLEAARFSHGDLAADNLLVRPDGTIAIVDFDGAHWPTSGFAPPSVTGTPGYAHPRGAPGDPDRRDRFPALLLWASLRVLVRHPRLRERWGDHPDRFGATLLWSHDDLRRPERSPLFAALDALDDSLLRPLLEVVRRAIRFSTDDTPPIAEIAERLEALGFPRLASPAGKPKPHARATASWATATRVPDVGPPVIVNPEQIAAPAESSPSPPVPAASHGANHVRHTSTGERQRRSAPVQQLADAVATRNTALAVQLWNEHRSLPEAAAFGASVHQLISQEAAAAIDRAIRRSDDAGLESAIAEAERAGIAPSPEARIALRAARERNATRIALRDALATRDYPTLAGLHHSGRLERLGPLDAHQRRMLARALTWPALERALAGDDDVAIAAAADPAIWSADDALPDEYRQRLTLARQRLRWLDHVRGALRERDGAVLRQLLSDTPEGALQRLTEVERRRIERVTAREAAVARLERALREGPDREVVVAMAEVERAGAPFSDLLDWTAVRGVVDRLTLADALREAAAADPPDTARLARLLPAARAALGGATGDDGPDWAALEQSVLRAAHLARLREAIASDNDGQIASAADPDPYGAIDLLSPNEHERVHLALRRRGSRRRIS